MKNMGAFSTENGVAGLILEEIPYTKTAYIRIHSALAPEKLLEECRGFCIAVGAERVYATWCKEVESYPKFVDILKMSVDRECVGTTDACVFPVTEDTLERWRELYNKKMEHVANSSYMTIAKAKEHIQTHEVYFVHRAGTLLGCGSCRDGEIVSVFSVYPGGGREVVCALCSTMTEDEVSLSVASTNEKAIRLYANLGFITTGVISSWYEL